jgi:hypothetical protein
LERTGQQTPTKLTKRFGSRENAVMPAIYIFKEKEKYYDNKFFTIYRSLLMSEEKNVLRHMEIQDRPTVLSFSR